MKFRALLLAGLVLLPLAAQAGPRDDVVDLLVKCTDIADKDARLACYDRSASQLRAAAQLPQAAGAQPPTAPPQQSSLLDSLNPFSGTTPPQGPAAYQMAYQPIGGEILPVTIGVADYSVAPSGAFSVTLDNGQVWREHDRDFATPRFRSDRKNVVTIAHGLIGGYNLTLEDDNQICKVARVK